MTIFLKSPIGSLAYLLLILAFISLWFNRKIWIWTPLFALSFVCAYYGGIADLRALVPISVALLCILSLTQEIPGFVRMFAVIIPAGIALAMFGHYITGFNNIELARQWQAGPDSVPVNLYMNYDKPIIPLFILAFLLPIISTTREWTRLFFIAIPWACLTCLVLLGISMLMNAVVFDPKLPSITFLWLIRQIFFISIPESVLFWGFIQREISEGLNNSASSVLAVLVTSLLYGALHLLIIPSFPFFILAFTTGILYSAIYQMTGRIEAPIFTQLTLNTIHFFFFTYPMLARG